MLGFVTITEQAGAADRLLAEAAATLEAQGLRLAGAVQQNLDRGPGRDCDMDLRILGDEGPAIRISQSLGTCSKGCRLDTGAFAQAVGRAEAVLARGADLVIVNKFGKQEGDGRGFREFIANALAADVPVLLAVPPEQLPAFRDFAGDLAEPVMPGDVIGWCRERAGQAAPAARIDARGLLCPLPVLRLRKRLLALPPGETVILVATDRAAAIDVPHFCAEAGHHLRATRDTGTGATEYTVERGPDA